MKEDGTISFVSELMGTLDTFLHQYEGARGPFRNDLERGLVISYALGVMRCELDSLWDSVAKTPAFAALHPRLVFEDCVAKDSDDLASKALEVVIEEELQERGWLTNEE